MNEKDRLKFVMKYLKEKKVIAIHLEGCRCVVCTYNYPNKEHIIQLKHCSRPMPYGTVIINQGY